MKTIKLTLLAALILAASAFGQLNTLVQTSLSGAITDTQTVFNVNSGTGIVAPSSGVAGSAIWVQEIGQPMGELMNVVTVTPPGTSGLTTLTVRRTGSRATAHSSGAMVLVATAPNWFQSKDPRGTCTLSGTYVTPWLNIQNGLQWLCSGLTGSWVPGWGNHSAAAQVSAATAVASVGGTTAVDGPLIHVSGTAAITAWLPSIGWHGGGFCVIPDGAYTTTTGGTTVATTRVTAISAASTAVAGREQCYGFDSTNSKLAPSY